MVGSVLPREECFCCKCSQAKGERTQKAFAAVPKPDYSPLLSLNFWFGAGASDANEQPSAGTVAERTRSRKAE